MKVSTRMRLRAVRAATLATLLLAAAVIVPGSAASAAPQPSKVPVPGPTAPPKLSVVATPKFNPADAKTAGGGDRTGAAVTINGFTADGQGLGVLYWTLRNVSAPSLGPGEFAAERWGASVIRPSGVSIVEGGERHATLVHAGGPEDGCLCYLNPPGIDYSSLGKGDEMQLSQVFAVSPQTNRITVEIPGFYPVPNIPVER